jgi:hypothetical protein
MRSKALLAVAVAALLLAVSTPANAQPLGGTDTAPGASCAGFPTGATRMTADANNDSRQVILICNGTTWEREQFAGETIIGSGASSCVAARDGAIRYNSTVKCVELCDAINWKCMTADACPNSLPASFTFTDQASVALSTLTTSNIVQITSITGCTVQVKVSGQGSPQYQTCSNATCTTIIQDWTSTAGQIQNNEYIRLRLTSSPSGNVTYLATVTVGARSVGWNVSTVGDCTASPPAGTFCADGTVYVGISPDGGAKMYTTPCPHGLTWDGTTCTGTATLPLWSQTNTINNGVTGFNTGEGNTTTLAGLSNADSPYSAATLCNSLVFGGQSDWYTPAEGEAQIIQSGCGVIPFNGCTSSTRRWTSTEVSATQARYWQPDGSITGTAKTGITYGLRCVRKD